MRRGLQRIRELRSAASWAGRPLLNSPARPTVDGGRAIVPMRRRPLQCHAYHLHHHASQCDYTNRTTRGRRRWLSQVTGGVESRPIDSCRSVKGGFCAVVVLVWLLCCWFLCWFS